MTTQTQGGGYGPGDGGPGGYGPPGGGAPANWGPPGDQGGPPPGFPPPGGGGGPPTGPNRPSPKSGKGLLIALVVGSVLLLGVIAAIVIMYFVVTVDPGAAAGLPPKANAVARKHLPSGCDLVVRADIERLLSQPSVKKHVVPAIDAAQAENTTAEEKRGLGELLRRTGIDPKADLKELVLCFQGLDGDKPRVVAAVGGDLRPEVFVDAVRETERTRPEIFTIAGRKAAKVTESDGEVHWFGQAADGAILFANDQALFERAAAESNAFQTEYSLELDREVTIVATEPLFGRLAAGPAATTPFARDIGQVKRLLGSLGLQSPKLEVRVKMSSAEVAQNLHTSLTRELLPGIREQVLLEESQVGEIEAFRAMKTRVEGDEIVIELPWTDAGLEQASQKIADAIREASKGPLSL